MIEAKNITFDREFAEQQQDVAAGDYVMLSVTDTGAGMPPDILKRVFKPFFTTKEVGKGTGLGLSMVYGFIKQSDGHIAINSEPGHGTTVKMYFCRGSVAMPETAAIAAPSMTGGNERILVVEDEASVRGLVFEQLSALGYDVSQAANAEEALTRLRTDRPFDLMLTDVVMPGRLNGKRLADEVERQWPATRIVFMSGYAESALLHDGRLSSAQKLLSKPFRKAELARVIRRALEEDRIPGVRPLVDVAN